MIEVQSLNQGVNMQELRKTSAEIKLEMADEARHSLEKAKMFLEET